jgi:hypothetical protein
MVYTRMVSLNPVDGGVASKLLRSLQGIEKNINDHNCRQRRHGSSY